MTHFNEHITEEVLGLTLKRIENARATSRIPKFMERNDSNGVSVFLRSEAVSDKNNSTRGNSIMGKANASNLRTGNSLHEHTILGSTYEIVAA